MKNMIEIVQERIILPCYMNSYDSLFGGLAMQWMDEVAFICAQKIARKKVVTVSVDNIKFLLPIKKGDIVKIVAKNKLLNGIRINIQVEIFDIDGNTAISGNFVFVAVSENNIPLKV
jgi:acyl-CoA hydrolase